MSVSDYPEVPLSIGAIAYRTPSRAKALGKKILSTVHPRPVFEYPVSLSTEPADDDETKEMEVEGGELSHEERGGTDALEPTFFASGSRNVIMTRANSPAERKKRKWLPNPFKSRSVHVIPSSSSRSPPGTPCSLSPTPTLTEDHGVAPSTSRWSRQSRRRSGQPAMDSRLADARGPNIMEAAYLAALFR